MKQLIVKIPLRKPCHNGVGIHGKPSLEAETVFVGWFCLFCFTPIYIVGKVFRNIVKLTKEDCT